MDHSSKFIFVFILVFCISGWAQELVIPVWPDGVPGEIKDASYIEAYDTDKPHRILRVSNPQLLIYKPVPEVSVGAAILICPGGGYRRLAMDIEGFEIAEWLTERGITGIILKYRLPSDRIMSEKKVGPLQDAQEAMRIIRRKSKKWNIDPEKIGIMGFSAGGHLAASLSTLYSSIVYPQADSVSARPDFSILVYPVISMDPTIMHRGSRQNLLGHNPGIEEINLFSLEKQVSRNTPPTFLVHSADDGTVPVTNSLRYYKSLLAFKVPAEIHIYEEGGHGYGMGNEIETNSTWPNLLLKWMKMHDWL